MHFLLIVARTTSVEVRFDLRAQCRAVRWLSYNIAFPTVDTRFTPIEQLV